MSSPLFQTALLSGVARATHDVWLNGLRLRQSSGYAVVQAFAAIAARVSLAAWRSTDGCYILRASGGARAVGSVQFTRPTAAAGAVTVKAGSVVRASRTGRDYVTTADAVFGGGDVGPIVAAAQASDVGWEYNSAAPWTTAAGDAMPGDIDTAYSLVLDPPAGDMTIVCAQASAFTGGAYPTLDAAAFDRGMTREPGESDSRLRQRVRALPDVVTAGALLRRANAVLAPFALTAQLVEAWSMGLGLFYDTAAGTENPDYDRTLFCLDDSRAQTSPFSNRLLDGARFRAFFAVVLPRIPTIAEHAFCTDDTATTPGARIAAVTGGRRGVAVYDAPRDASPATVLDGYDVARHAILVGLSRSLHSAKAAGVRGTIVVV